MTRFKCTCIFQGMKCLAGIKPCLLFTGDAFEQEDEYIRLKNLLIGRSHHMLLYEVSSGDQALSLVYWGCL